VARRLALTEVEQRAVASAAAAAALQLAEDFTFPMRNREEWEATRRELRDGFLTVVAETFPLNIDTPPPMAAGRTTR
jgi:hypothetical protein